MKLHLLPTRSTPTRVPLAVFCALIFSAGTALIITGGKAAMRSRGTRTPANTSSNPLTSMSRPLTVSNPTDQANVVNACALIEKSEIASVQGLPVQQIQPTRQKHGDLDFSQCYYTAISADGSKNLSVYLQVIERSSTSARRVAVKEFWEARFGRESNERESKEKRNEEKDEAEAINPPLHVSGIGDEAFWLGNSRGGALFVLKKDKVVRVTVGGADVKTQMEKSKTLAKKALTRLV